MPSTVKLRNHIICTSSTAFVFMACYILWKQNNAIWHHDHIKTRSSEKDWIRKLNLSHLSANDNSGVGMVCLCCKDELCVALKGPKGLGEYGCRRLVCWGSLPSVRTRSLTVVTETPRGCKSVGVSPLSPVCNIKSYFSSTFEFNPHLLCFRKNVSDMKVLKLWAKSNDLAQLNYLLNI